MNVLLIIGLVLFVGVIIWVYVLFIFNATDVKNETAIPKPPSPNALERCKQLYDEGMHGELQRYAQRELAKNYGNAELRRILAKSLMATGDEQMAIMHYEAILSIAPYDIETQELLARYYCENGPKSRAIELYEQIMVYDSGNVNAVEALAKLYEEALDYPKAIEMYNLLIDSELDEQRIIELTYILADLYTKDGNNEKAYEEYQKISQSDPDNLEILMLLADLAYKNKYWSDCLKYYEKIISIVGDDFEMLEKVAKLHVILENWSEAVATYKKIISLEDESSTNYLYHQNELCSAMIKNGEVKRAIDKLKDLILLNPKETSFAFTLAQAYTTTGEYQKGVALYNNLMNELPSEQGELIIKYISKLICFWAQDMFEKGNYSQAFDKFFEALKYDEENDEVYFQLGKCNYYIKSFQDAISYFKRAISIDPKNSLYYFGLGCAYDETGSFKDAKIAFYDAINIDPMNIKARIAYAISLTKELEFAQSIEQFNEVLKYIPDNADTLYNIALAYENVGDVERAIKFYKKAIDIDNNHKEANHNLELILGEPYHGQKEETEEEILNEGSEIEAQIVSEPNIEEENSIFSPEEETKEGQNPNQEENNPPEELT